MAAGKSTTPAKKAAKKAAAPKKKAAVVEAEVHAAAGHDHASHPTTQTYWKIFWLLFAITAVEVALFYWSIPGVNLNNAALGILAIGKFTIVVGYFMHLRFDSRILRRLFVTGLILATLVYVAYMLTLGVFIDKPGN